MTSRKYRQRRSKIQVRVINSATCKPTESINCVDANPVNKTAILVFERHSTAYDIAHCQCNIFINGDMQYILCTKL